MVSFYNNIFRNKIKDIYYKYFFYKIPVKWKKDYLEAEIKKGKIIKLVYSDIKDAKYYSSKYYSAELITILNELKGYFKEYIPKKGDYVVDVGAYEGGMTIIMSHLVGKNGKVIAFEPFKDALLSLKKNIKLNNLNNVIIIEKGLWSEEKELPFMNSDVGSRIDPNGKNKIKGTTLDNELKKLKIPLNKIKFIKMDIEGAEIEALKGCKKLMKQGISNFAIASYHILNGKKTYKELENIFKDNKYNTFTSYPKHLTTYGFKLKKSLKSY